MAAKKSTSSGSAKGTAIKKKQALEGYVEKGTVTAACQRAKIGRRTWYNWIEDDPKFKNAADNAYEQVTDDIEETAIEAARSSKDITMLIFMLKNRRARVYKDKVDIRAGVKTNKVEDGEVSKFLKQHPKAAEAVLDDIEQGLHSG